MRWGSAALVAVVLAAPLGCSADGSGGGASDAPSVAEFCQALSTFQASVQGVDPAADLTGYITTLQDAADELDDVGVPGQIPDDAREGFRITVDRIDALSATATLDELSELGDVPEDDQARLDALDDYIASACPDLTDSSTP